MLTGDTFLETGLARYTIQSRLINNLKHMDGVLLLADAYGKAEHNVFPGTLTAAEFAQAALDNKTPIISLEFFVWELVRKKEYIWEKTVIKEEKVRVWGQSLGQVSVVAQTYLNEHPALLLRKPKGETD
jgi:hypothetical protein